MEAASLRSSPRRRQMRRACAPPYNDRLEVTSMFRTGNPALKDSTFRGLARVQGEAAMTVQGTVNKTGISLLILLAAAALVWNGTLPQPIIFVGLIGGLVTALVTVFKPTASPIT